MIENAPIGGFVTLKNYGPEEERFPVGTVVKLISGGPDMTVINQGEGHGKIFCLWFSGNDRRRSWFPKDSVTVVGFNTEGPDPINRCNACNTDGAVIQTEEGGLRCTACGQGCEAALVVRVDPKTMRISK